MEENEKHLKEIASLKQAAARSRKWADKNEATKIAMIRSKSMTARVQREHISVPRQKRCRAV